MIKQKDKCTHCLEMAKAKGGTLCLRCLQFPRCEICDVIFGLGVSKPSLENEHRCESCLYFEEMISNRCFLCTAKIPMFFPEHGKNLRMFVRGNCCASCSATASENAKGKKKKRVGKYIDYLAMVEKGYKKGTITKEEWEYALAMNPQDVK